MANSNNRPMQVQHYHWQPLLMHRQPLAADADTHRKIRRPLAANSNNRPMQVQHHHWQPLLMHRQPLAADADTHNRPMPMEHHHRPRQPLVSNAKSAS